MTEVHGPRHPRGGLTTIGVGTVRAVPDVVVVRLAAQSTDPQAATALAAAGESSAAIIAALVAAGTERRDIRTVSTSSWTDPGQAADDAGQGGRRERTTVSIAVEATLRDTATAGQLAAGAVVAGGSCGRLEATTFQVADPGPAVAQARELAFDQAVAAAAQLAGLTGRPLGRVIDVREESEPAPRVMALKATRAMVADLPLEGGQQEVTVRLVVRHGWSFPPDEA